MNQDVQVTKKFILPGSITYTDCWEGYMGLQDLGYSHGTVNHSKEFISSDGSHTLTIESTWRALKGFHLPRSGCSDVGLVQTSSSSPSRFQSSE
jgi:hypothetical protein